MRISIEDLLRSGVHFGHKSERWNPKMKPYIFAERNGIYIIDLLKTLEQLQTAHSFVTDIVANGGEVMFVGSKKQAKEIIKQEATACGAFYVSERWLGGLLTNFKTVKKTIDRLKTYEKMMAEGAFKNLTKKEILSKDREIEKLQKVFGGIKNMGKLPDAIFVVDTKKHRIAIHEAGLMDIPVIAIVDTNTDPEAVDIPIPGNDDAIKSIEIITQVVTDAVNTGMMLRKESSHGASQAKESHKKPRRQHIEEVDAEDKE